MRGLLGNGKTTIMFKVLSRLHNSTNIPGAGDDLRLMLPGQRSTAQSGINTGQLTTQKNPVNGNKKEQ